MIKKILLIISVLLTICSTNVFTKTEYEVFKKGDFVGLFYNQENKELGIETKDPTRNNIIIGNDSKDEKYVKALVVGVGRVGNGYTEQEPIDFSPSTFLNSDGPTPLHTIINKLKEDKFQDKVDEKGNGPFFKDFSLINSVGFISLNEMIDLFGAKEENGKYTIDINKKINNFTIKTMFEGLAKEIKKEVDESNNTINELVGFDIDFFQNGFYTSTLQGNKIYVVKFAFNNNELSGMSIELVNLPESSIDDKYYALVPTVYYQKNTVEVEEEQPPKEEETTTTTTEITEPTEETTTTIPLDVDPKTDSEYACYLCNNEYIWQENNNECKLVSEITSKSKCVKPVETGVYSYILEGLLLVIGLLVVYYSLKKYNMFTKI